MPRNLKHRNRKRGICQACMKVIYATQEEARRQLGYLAGRDGDLALSGEGLFAMQAYRCAAGWWHLGRNGETRKMIEKFLRGGNVDANS